MGRGLRLNVRTALATTYAIDATALGSGRGGDETYIRSILRGLHAASEPGDHFEAFVRPGVAGGAPASPRISYNELRPAGSLRLVSSLARGAHALRGRPLLAYMHAPVRGRPYALVVTDLSFRHHPELFPRSVRWRLDALVPRQIATAAVVVTLSSFCRDDIVDAYGVDPDRVHVVPCAVEAAALPNPAAQFRIDQWMRSAGIDRPFVLALGNLHPRKNVVRLVEAFSSLDVARRGDVLLVVAGGRWWGEGSEEAVARRTASVRMVGRVDDDVRDHLLRNAKLLAYPSIFEGFGLPPVEAMAVGTPVVTSNVSAIPEVTAGAAELVDPLDVVSIASGIDRVLTDESRRTELRTRGLAVARTYDHRRTGTAALAALRAASS